MSEALRQGAEAVVQRLRAQGHSAYFAGGCVRDLLLGHPPKDWDVATSATPEQVAALFKRTLLIGAAFGVVKVLWRPGQEYEVATYRTEGGYSDGRRPDQVHYSTSPLEDVERRDFTINALLLDPAPAPDRALEAGAAHLQRPFGMVLDFVKGVPDLEAGLIRAVGDPHQRFLEDRLRMLRALRFASRFGFRIEPATFAAIQAHAAEIKVVSVERVVAELDGIWRSPRPEHGLALLRETGLLSGLAAWWPGPGPEADQQLTRLPFGPERILVAWALVLGPSGSKVEARMRGLKFSRERIQQVARLVGAEGALRRFSILAPPEQRRWVVEGGLLAADFQRALLAPGDPALQAWREVAEELERDPLPGAPLVGGADLMALGLAPGPEFKRYLQAIDEAVYARSIRTREEALAQLKALVPSAG